MKILLKPQWLMALCLTACGSLALLVFGFSAAVREWRYVAQHGQEAAIRELASEEGRLYPLDRRLVPLFAPSTPDTFPAGMSDAQRSRIEAILKRIQKQYGVTVRVNDPSRLKDLYAIDARPYAPDQLEQYLHALYGWLLKYPPGYFDTIGLRTIHLFDAWSYNGVMASGFFIDKQSIGIDKEERVFHHELWHLSDGKVFGQAGDNTGWLAAKYGVGHTPDIHQKSGIDAIASKLYLDDRPPGYASAYGAYAGPDEDQATTVESLFTDYDTLMTWSAQEPALMNAVTYLKQFYGTQSHGLMNDQYWNDLANNTVLSDRYWKQQGKVQ